MKTGMASHHKTQGKSDEWLTPPTLVDLMRPMKFDLDPCASNPRPWPTAVKHIALPDDGLEAKWKGRVWLNPPYGPPSVVRPWVRKLARHGDGVALLFARTETRLFHEFVFPTAHALIFLDGRLRFWRKTGMIGEGKNAGAPSVLIAYGKKCADDLAKIPIKGYHVRLR